MNNKEIAEKVQDTISSSNHFDEVFESELQTFIETSIDNIDFSDYQDEFYDVISEYCDIDDIIREEIRNAVREKLEYC